MEAQSVTGRLFPPVFQVGHADFTPLGLPFITPRFTIFLEEGMFNVNNM